MEFEIMDLNPTKKSISFKFFKEEVEKEKNEVVKKLKAMAKLPGFRPGKVPPEIIKARFKKEIEEEILDNLVNKNLENLIKEKNWKVVGDIIFSSKSFEDEFLKAEIEFYILPKLELPSLEGIDAELEEIAVTEEEIKDEIEKLQKSKPIVENSNLPVGEESVALCKVVGKYEGEEKEIDFRYKFLSPKGNDPVPELLGKNVGEEVIFSKEFPPDDPSPHRGKKVNFKAKIEEIKIVKYPEINDDFVKKEFPNLNSVEDLNEFIKNKILSFKKQKAEKDLKEKILNQLLEKIEIFVPEPMLQREINSYLHNTALTLYENNYDIKDMDWEKLSK